MKHIKKGQAPKSLIYYKSQPNAIYENYREKDDVRESLLQEQGYICCYCTSRIGKDKMKIEHWLSQSEYEDNSLDYDIMLGACLGFQKSPYHEQCCDTHRGNQKLSIIPTDLNMVNTIKYRADGTVLSEDSRFNKDINETLNLNVEFLKRNRRAMLDSVIKFMRKKDGDWNPALIKRAISVYSRKDTNGTYKPYCQVAIQFLERKLNTKQKVK